MNTLSIRFEEILGNKDMIRERRDSGAAVLNEGYDDELKSNQVFDYFIVEPDNALKTSSGKYSSFIFLFHGLNERSWDKYKPWAESLATNTKSAVILFPLAFHINRAPEEWSNPRIMTSMMNKDKPQGKSLFNLTFVNFALSKRIKADPNRFYLSGKQTIYNVCQLLLQIREGNHQYIDSKADFGIFAYSIGALLSQVMLQANPFNLFGKSKLFMFCGGSLLGEMNGNSRMIMDKESFKTLRRYYRKVYIKRLWKNPFPDTFDRAFASLIENNLFKKERRRFYLEEKNRIKVISLKNDTVVPTKGIKLALGRAYEYCLEEMDFTYKYSHETPFPANLRSNVPGEYWFDIVFGKASAFLSFNSKEASSD